MIVASGLAQFLGGEQLMGARNAIRTVGLLAGYVLFVRWREKRPLTEFGLAGLPRELGAGLVIGAGLVAATMGLLWSLGHLHIDGFNGGRAALRALPLLTFMVVMEEVLFRLLLLRWMEKWWGTTWGLIASSLLFGLMHLGGGEAHLGTALMLGVEGGFVFGAAYLLTRRFWLCAGMHLGWNFTEISIFTADPTLAEKYPGLLMTSLKGPTWLTGGDSLQGSVIVFVLCLATGFVLLRRSRARPSRPEAALI